MHFCSAEETTHCADSSNLRLGYLNDNGESTSSSDDVLKHVINIVNSNNITLNPGGNENVCSKLYFNHSNGLIFNALEQFYLKTDEIMITQEDGTEVKAFPTEKEATEALSWLHFGKNLENDFKNGKRYKAALGTWHEIVQGILKNTTLADIEHTLDNDFTGIYNQIVEGLNTQPLLLIGSGQGNQFANIIYKRMLSDSRVSESNLKKYANFQISSPTAEISSTSQSYGDYLLSDEDKSLDHYRSDVFRSILPANVEFEVEKYVYLGNTSYPVYRYEKYDYLGNDVDDVYSNPLLRGKPSGEENYRSMSSIFMDKLSVLAEKITGRHCEPIDDFELKVLGTYMFHQVTGSDPKYMYLGLYDSDGKALTGDTSLYGLYSVPPTYSTNYEPDEVKPVLDLNGDYLAFNQVVYVSGQEHAENLKGRAFALIHHSDYEKLQNNKPMECGIKHYTSVRSLISHRVDNEYDPNYAYLPQGPFRGVLDVKTADEVVNVTYNGKQMGKEEDDASFCTDLSYNKDCDWGIKDSITLPGSFQVTLINGSEISVGLELPPIDFDIKLEVKGVQVERGLYEVEATFTGEDVFSRYGKFYSEVWVSDGETNTNTGKLSPEGLVNSKGSGPELGHFSCGRRAYVVPIQQLGQSSKYYRFDLMKVMDPPC